MSACVVAGVQPAFIILFSFVLKEILTMSKKSVRRRTSTFGFSTWIRPYRWRFAGVLLLAFGAQAAGLVQPLVTREIFENLEGESSLALPIVVLVVVAVAGLLLNYTGELSSGRLSERAARDLRESSFASILRARIPEIERLNQGDVLARLSADMRLIQQTAIPAMVDLVVVPVAVAGGIVLMFLIDTVLAAVVIGVLAVTSIAQRVLFAQMQDLTESAQRGLGAALGVARSALGGLRTVKASVTEARERARFGEHSGAAFRAGVRFEQRRALTDTTTYAAIDLTFILVLAVGAVRISTGDVSVGDLVAILLFIFIIEEPMESLVGSLSELAAGLGALRRIGELTQISSEDYDTVGRSAGCRHRPGAYERRNSSASVAEPESAEQIGTVRFETVTAAYDQTPVLEEVTMELTPGLTALIGPSGSGKTTTLSLLMRFIDPTLGKITVDGQDITALSVHAHRRRIGLVQQEAPVLGTTIGEAITYGAARANDDAIWQALDTVELTTWLHRQPRGLETPLHDAGTNLSGGQRQRLAIARALVQNRPILLLDEATSQLDPANEERLVERLREHSRNQIVAAITHRPAMAIHADRIAVFTSGRLHATGTHHDLANDPVYRDIATRWNQ
ncbi:ABC transporter ATP-binding protein [Nesterenkonia sp. CL21]|uniref:ABC transporter ATP-binding protein n=1 Tax=Nesterenkonia sp. CL21 TaxID=3064894 RepID=UPI002879F099|nr:ABC transporter ATP-binding protein [Nesterenkonia sp. CL21]MDS2172384.1 ABC transporter ATP-binding protein [Nesterenkonia sp. CL21]